MTTSTPPPAESLLAKLKARISENDDYARQLEEAVRNWETLDQSPNSLLDQNDTVLVTETPANIPWPSRPQSPVPAEEPIHAELLAALPEPIVLLDSAGVVKYWNRAAEEMFGWMSYEVLGKAPPFVAAAHRAEHDEILSAARRDSPIRERIVSRRGKDQRARVFSLHTSLTANGHIAMRFAAPPAQPPLPKIEKIDHLVASVSHDFNNVLTAIIGSADLLADRTPIGTAQREWVDIIRLAAQHAWGLTKQLKGLSRPLRGPAQAIDLSETIEKLLPLASALLPSGVRIKTQLDPHLPAVMIDATAVEQILLNLTTNAGQAMPRGGVVQIRTAEVSRGDAAFVALTVADSGSGMDDTIRARLFEPNFTTKAGGTGLGLANVREAVLAAGGEIEVDSHPGLGSVFRVFLPASGDRPQAFGTGRSALVADDDPASREFVKRVLEGAGFNVHEASTTEEALNTARWLRHDLDLLVADIVMPTGGGRTLAQKLARQNPELVTLLISGYPQGDLQLEDKMQFLSKPFRARQLLESVRHSVQPTG